MTDICHCEESEKQTTNQSHIHITSLRGLSRTCFGN